MTTTVSGRSRTSDMVIVDADVHVSDTPGALAPYCDMPWRMSLEELGQGPGRYLDIPAFAPSLKLDPPIPGTPAPRSVRSAAEMRDGLSALGIDIGILFPDNLLLFAPIPNIEYATALSHAYNRWLMEEWLLREPDLYGALLACPQNPQDSAAEIERYAKEDKIVAVYLPTAGVNPLWGDRRYDPILAAAEAADLPVLLHSVTLVSPAFPCQLDQFENHYARQMLSHSFAMMANLVSIMHTGVPARYPKLRIAFTEAGLAWVPYMMWRLDKYYNEYRRLVPFLEKRPSEYMKERMWFATQPIEEPDNASDLVETIAHLGGPERVLFASDWPHHDFDHPRAITKLPMSAEAKRKIMGENALELFGIPAPAGKSV
ncbi:MAG: amidohydrolase [Thermomicrobiales bacterium]|nr:amidohydrolase [Thermomicrobiales bacterium]